MAIDNFVWCLPPSLRYILSFPGSITTAAQHLGSYRRRKSELGAPGRAEQCKIGRIKCPIESRLQVGVFVLWRL